MKPNMHSCRAMTPRRWVLIFACLLSACECYKQEEELQEVDRQAQEMDTSQGMNSAHAPKKCAGTLDETRHTCTGLTRDQCVMTFVHAAPGTFIQCAMDTARQCLSIGGICKGPQLARLEKVGKGSCWDKNRQHSAGYKSLQERDNKPETCYEACIREYGENCAGFDTRGKCLIYTTSGHKDKVIVTTRNCAVNGKKDGCDNWSEGICYKVHPASDDTEDPDFWDRPWVKNPFDKIFFDDLRIKFKPSQYLSQTSVVSMQSKKPPFTVSFTIKDDANIRNSGASRNQAGHIAFGIIRVGDIQTGMEGAWKMQKFTGIHSERNRPCPWVRGKACKKYPAHAREKDVKYTIIAKPDGTVVMNDGIAGEVMTDEFVKWDGLRAKKFSPDDRFKLYFGNVVYGSGEKGEGNEVTDIEWEGTGDDTEGDKPEAGSGFHCDFSQGTPCGGVLGGQFRDDGFPKFANNQLYLIPDEARNNANWLALDDVAAYAAFTATWKGKLTGGNGFVFNYGPECKSTNIPNWWGHPVHSAVCKDFKGLHVQFRRWQNQVIVWMDGKEVKRQSCTIQTGKEKVEHKITVDAKKRLTVEYYGKVVFSAFQLKEYAPTAAWTYMLGFGNGGGKGDVYLNTLDIETTGAPAQASPMAFLFGGQAINSVAGAILDPGNSYGKAKTPDGLDFGWLCNGNPMNGEQENSQKAGIRGNARSVYGLNHFDRNNKCRSGNTYLPVNWKIDVPPGSYKVFVLFPESRKGGCAVQGELACTGDNGKCEYDKTVTVGNDGFQITGYGHDSPTPKLQCHSVGLVRIEPSS